LPPPCAGALCSTNTQQRHERSAASGDEPGSTSGVGGVTTGNWPAPRNPRGARVAEAISVSGPISGTDKTLSFETGRLAQQSQGAVIGRIGNTVVLVTANAAKGVREGIDFFPLTVDIEERMYAAGKIPGSFFRREGRPSDQAILTA